MQVVHTAGLPPSSGSTILPNIGSTTKSSAALRKTASVNASPMTPPELLWVIELIRQLCSQFFSALADHLAWEFLDTGRVTAARPEAEGSVKP
jgi:hypothetical protein